MICLDSSFLIDFLKKDRAATQKIKEISDDNSFGVTAISVFEVALGFYLMKDGHAQKYDKFRELISNLEVLELDLNSAILSSKISATLTREGNMVDQADCLIAGTMLSRGMNQILTKNERHFSRVKGIKVISY